MPASKNAARNGTCDLPQGISVVIPCFNSEKSLGPLVEQLAEVLPGFAGHFEVILVNDDSGDGTWNVIRELSSRHRSDALLRAAQRDLVRRTQCAIRDHGHHG